MRSWEVLITRRIATAVVLTGIQKSKEEEDDSIIRLIITCTALKLTKSGLIYLYLPFPFTENLCLEFLPVVSKPSQVLSSEDVFTVRLF